MAGIHSFWFFGYEILCPKTTVRLYIFFILAYIYTCFKHLAPYFYNVQVLLIRVNLPNEGLLFLIVLLRSHRAALTIGPITVFLQHLTGPVSRNICQHHVKRTPQNYAKFKRDLLLKSSCLYVEGQVRDVLSL